jgi:small subunit ribosomal protein S16
LTVNAFGANREYERVVKLRLKRMGAKKRPSYRIIATESRSPRDGRFIEAIGFYDPLTNPATINLKEDRCKYWLSVGAQPTDTVRSLFVRQGLIEKTGEAAASSDSAPSA